MAAPPTARSFQAGEVETNGFLNSLSAPVNLLLNPPRVSASQSAPTTATTATWLLVVFQSEDYDTDNMHSVSTNTGRITINTDGCYDVTFQLGFAANTTGDRGVMIRKNSAGSAVGGTLVAEMLVPVSAAGSAYSIGSEVTMNTGDYFEFFAYQSSGANLALTSTAHGVTATARWAAKP